MGQKISHFSMYHIDATIQDKVKVT